jgi:hypothetical protein
MTKRLYSLFEKQPDGKWKRISNIALHKDRAVRFFQNALLAPYFSGDCGVRELRVVKE